MSEKNKAAEYLLAFILEPMEKGEQFVGWPLHITLVPTWFRAHRPEARILLDLQTALEPFKPFTVRGISREQFGWRGQVQVTALASSELHDLHRALLVMLGNSSYKLVKTNHMGDSYQPHITKKGNAEFKPGHELLVDRVYLVKAPIANPRTRTKTVAGIVEL